MTAIFRRPLGLPIPHTALIPHNWERMAERVGVMVGGRVLTKDYVREEIARIDFSGLLARAAERVSRADLESVTRTAARWLGEQLTPAAAAELLGRARRALVHAPVAPLLATTLRIARRQGWDQRILDGAFSVLAGAMERPEFRHAVGEVIDDLLARYRERLGVYPRLFMGLATMLGVLDRDRLVAALHVGLREVARIAITALRAQGTEVLADLERRLGDDPALAARSRRPRSSCCRRRRWRRWCDEAAEALTRALRADPGRRAVGAGGLAGRAPGPGPRRADRRRRPARRDRRLGPRTPDRADRAAPRAHRRVHRERRAGAGARGRGAC